MVRFKRLLTLSLTFITLSICILFNSSVKASESLLTGGNGTYTVPISLDLKMGQDNFTNPVTVEKEDGRYYMCMGYSSSIGYMNLNISDMEVGKVEEKIDGWTYYTYTLSLTNLKSKLNFTVYITAMSREVSFNATLDLESATKISDTIRDLGERPAEFVPVISTTAASEYSLKTGITFPIPECSATIGNEEASVSVTAYYQDQAVEIREGKLQIDNVGEYKIVYKATSNKYKTSLGNDTYSTYTVTINSLAEDNYIVKYNDINNILPDSVNILAGKIDTGASFILASNKMVNIADNYEVFSVEFLDSNGEEIRLDGNIELMFRASDYFDRTKVKVYHMDEDGSLTELASEGFGRYVRCETNKTGTFIVCVSGVSFHMSMWGYVLILCGALILIVSVIVGVILIIKHKKKLKNNEDNSYEFINTL